MKIFHLILVVFIEGAPPPNPYPCHTMYKAEAPLTEVELVAVEDTKNPEPGQLFDRCGVPEEYGNITLDLNKTGLGDPYYDEYGRFKFKLSIDELSHWQKRMEEAHKRYQKHQAIKELVI